MSNPRAKLLQELEDHRGNRAIVVGASWRDDIATDLDEAAARVFAEVVDSVAASAERPDRLTLVVVARGGHVAFADAVARTLAATETEFELVVPTLVTGVGTLLALAAEKVLIHPHGGVGAYDTGPLHVAKRRLTHDVVDDVPALGGIAYERIDPELPARLAAGMRERRLSRALAERLASDDVDLDRLSQLQLGGDLGLRAAGLTEVGLTASTFDDAASWELFVAVERALGILEQATPAYTESDLGDEVEFEPAMGIVSAIIESTERTITYELDTGRPDPDTGRYTGAWNW